MNDSKARGTAGDTLAQPLGSPTHEVGCEQRELFLEGDAACGAQLEGVHLGDHVGFLDASLNDLPGVVACPGRTVQESRTRWAG
jgi:hypothetical protein